MKGRSHRLQSHHESHEDWVDGSWTVDCVCGVNFDDGEEMVNCDECGVWVHTRCSRYVKGDELFACDKCKSKNNRNNDSEETEVAQLLVELPTKTIRLESNYTLGNESYACRWSNSRDGRVHVQGIPGGDPSLFSGLPSVFTPELWKCTGYVPKKFNFQYREFPCWDEKKKDGDGRNEEENENTVDKGAGVLFSLSKESLFAAPIKALVGVRGRDEDVSYDRKPHSKKWENEDGEVRHTHIGVKKERSLLQPVVIHSGKRKKEDIGILKDRSGKKKARAAEREADVKKRSPQVVKPAFTSANDAKPLEFYEDRGPKSFKDDQITKNKNVRDLLIQERESDSSVAVGSGFGKHQNHFPVVEHPSDDLPSDSPRYNFSIGAELKEQKASPEVPVVVNSSLKVSDVATLPWEHHDCDRTPVRHEGDGDKNSNLDKNMFGSAGSDVKPQVDEPASAELEEEGSQINDAEDMPPNSFSPGAKELQNNNSKGVLNCQSSLADLKHSRESCDNISENSKVNDISLSGSPSTDPKAVGLDRTSIAVSDFQDKVDELTADSCQHKQQFGGPEGSVAMLDCPSEPKHELGFEDPSKSGGTVLNSPLLQSQRKMILCVGKSASHKFKSTESSSSDHTSKQQMTLESTSSIRKDHAAGDVVKTEDSSDISRKTVKEHPKVPMNSTSKVTSSGKISHTSVPKRTITDSKDPLLYESSKAFSAQNSCETSGLLQNESVSHLQNKVPTPGLPTRGERLTASNSYSSSKGNQALSTNFSVPANLPATLSDEELALLLHQELNSSPRVPRVPRVRHAGSLPHLASPTATSMLVKRSSSSGGKDHSLVPRRKSKDCSKDATHRSYEPEDEGRRTDRVLSSPDRRKDKGYTAGSLSNREENRSSAAVHSLKKNNPPTSTSTANSGPSSSNEVNDQHLSFIGSPRNFSDEETGTARGPVHRTLPGLINEIMSKGRRMTYEELCNAVLPHWHSLRKHNGERYAYSSHSQAVLDCLRNRHEWARLVDRGPKTSASRKRRKIDPEESENDYGNGRTSKEGDRKSLESQKEEFPKGKRKARKRRRLALQGRGIKDVRKRRKADLPSDDDTDPFSNSSDESLFSEDEIQGGGAGPVGSESSTNSDEMRAM